MKLKLYFMWTDLRYKLSVAWINIKYMDTDTILGICFVATIGLLALGVSDL